MPDIKSKGEVSSSRQSREARTTDAFPIIGIGFSAGGLEALKKFLAGVDRESNAAYIVVQHFPDNETSHLREILERDAPLPVREMSDGGAPEPGTIHVLGGSTEVVLRRGLIHFPALSAGESGKYPIDRFFGSLALDNPEMAAGVILSGSGNDGTVGLRKIKASGGMCLVQDPTEARFPGMPESAIESGCVDFVGPAGKLAERVEHYFIHRERGSVTADSLDEKKENTLNRILCLVRAQTGNDFRNYKRSSILRRIERRMCVVDTEDFDDYLELLRQDEKEVGNLARDMLISVTSFFRDPEVWEFLERDVLPPLIESKNEGEEVRVWVPACATGEEVYSYAILLSEAIDRSGKHLPLQIYGTDIDDRSRKTARAATYPSSIAHDVGEERTRKFFTSSGKGMLTILPALREKVIFARQNILSDPPFSRMDLVSCRNLLIYLDREMQQRVVNLLHFALNEGGIAVLGNAESPGPEPAGLFKAISRNLRIYQRLDNGKTGARKRFNRPSVSPIPDQLFPASNHTRPNARSIEEMNRKLVMRHFDAASLLVDDQFDIRYQSGATHQYLIHPEGTPSTNLGALVPATVGQKIRKTAKRVLESGSPASFVTKIPGGRGQRTRITLEPVRLEEGQDGFFIIFEAAREEKEIGAPEDSANSEGGRIEELDREFKDTQDELRNTVGDLAHANDELKSANEEVMSMNEELQSSNEELETSKEELQSLNDELTNVNKELSTKVAELDVAFNDMDNLLASGDIATIFLDESLHIKFFTPSCSRLFNLIEGDIGRPISDLVSKFDGDDLVRMCRCVLADLTSREDEISSGEGSRFLRRINPYRTKENRIEGVVVTFNDVTRLKRAEAKLVEAEQCLRLAISHSPVTIFAQNTDLEYTYVLNQPDIGSDLEMLGKTDRELFPADFPKLAKLKSAALSKGGIFRERVEIHAPSGRSLWFDMTLEPSKNKRGEVVGLLGAAVNVTEQVEREVELEAANNAKSRFLSSLSHDLRTPLTAIMGMSEVLGDFVDENQRKIGREIGNACNHLIGSLDSVLHLAHLQGGQAKLETTPVDLGKIFDEVRDAFDPASCREESGPRILIDGPEPAPLFVMADHGALLRVLGNLLGNALKFCPDSPVTLRAVQESDQARIEVEDQGPGISEEFIRDIFKPFTQEERSNGGSLHGCGLGLSICHELVRLLEGSIEVESEPGKGTTMVVRLPLARSDGSDAPSEDSEVHGPGRELRTLICDDHPATCTVIRQMLKKHDIEVAENEAEFEKHIDQVEAVLLDINFHGKDRGIEIMKRLRSDPKYKNLRITAFTAHALPEQKEEFLEMGFDDYLGKPFRREALLEKIQVRESR